MLLLLIRHAQAAEQDTRRYPDDSLRPLVPKGRRIQRRVSRELYKRNLIPSVILSSPWKRAWQTARIVVEETGLPKRARVVCPELAAPPNLAALAKAVGDVEPDATIGLVGHEPWMSELASLLLVGSRDGLGIDFAKSGVLGIETDEIAPGRGTLRMYLRPE